MAPPSRRIKAPKLPDNLLKELGVGENSYGGRKNQFQSRKDRRKAERVQKKTHRTSSTKSYHAERAAPPKTNKKTDTPSTKEPKPILKKGKKQESEDEEEEFDLDEDEEERFDEGDDINLDEDDDDDELDLDEDDDEDNEDDHENDEEESDIPPQPKSKSQPKVSKTILAQLEQDDKEIAQLEKKLGIKGRKSLPKSFQEDGLLDLLEGLPGVDEETSEKRKRKSEADEWLAAKRRKAEEALKKTQEPELDEEEEEDSEMDDEDDGLDDLLEGLDSDEENDDDNQNDDMSEGGSDEDGEDDISGEDEDGDDFGGFDEDEDEDEDEADEDEETVQKPPERVRENPYVAPTTGQTVAKYVPPSKRQPVGSEAELVARIRRQTQGLINRMTESNLLSIIMDFEKLYRDNPRQHLTSNIIDLLLIQVCEPTTLPDTLLVLTAGFATGIFKAIGMDFGAQLIQEVIERYDKYYEEAKEVAKTRPDVPKQTSNIITFLSELYNFQLVGPNLLFDFIRALLGDLSELNAELLLRIVRIAGPALRQDDPMSLKDIVTLIRPAVAKIGEKNLSVRTKFMIETINDLKNNKMKTGVGASAVLQEHTTKMKKLLGTLKTTKTAEPLRMTLADIRDADKKGKWWLVGASWAGKDKDGDKKASAQDDDAIQTNADSDDESFMLEDVEDMPDLGELARENQMNTDVRRSIFVSIMSATDYEDAYYRILKLRLNKERQREVPYVIIQCAGAEQHYNPYYTLVAKKLCSDRKIRWSFQDALWKLFRRLGESVFGDDVEDEEDEDAMDMRRLVNIAKLFGAMVAGGSLGLAILKCLNLPYLQTKTRALVEIMLITVLLEAGKGGDKGRDEVITSVFAAVEGVPELARGLQWFIKKVVRKSDLAGGAANTKLVKEGCKTAMAALEHALLAAEGLME
ncbi:hypothetical protein B0T20DRAFT_473128 [Sordaria brevicollis]|uniref:MI domain-containing protein n=1 Tax=Sordaria brevicollis TaxID=83679 RepID=A0AAE0P1C6_SORBR|nr:hypothetical protein B0T20DRAFT_473128 [Sordaria brevicollis]